MSSYTTRAKQRQNFLPISTMPGAHKFQRTERGAEPVEDMEMYSDEDLEGGFEDVEDAEDDVVDAEPDDVTERVPSKSSL